MKIGVVGLGWVGASVAISTLHRGFARELVLCDIKDGLAEGEALDLAHGASFYPATKVRAGSLDDMNDCDAVVITAGRGGRPGESRLDLLRDNAETMRSIASALGSCRGSLIIVSNPVDVLTHVALRASELPAHRVFGTGTMLDTARLRHALGRELDVDPRSVHAQVFGEHGDSEFVGWSSARIGGVALRGWPGWTTEREAAVADEVRTAAYEIIARKGATNHAIGLVTAALMHWSTRDTRRVLTVSRLQTGACGIDGVVLSLPTIVGRQGAMEVFEPDLNGQELEALHRSADVLRTATASL